MGEFRSTALLIVRRFSAVVRFAHCPPILGSSTYLFLGFVFFVPLAWVSFVPLLGLLQCRQLCPQSGYLGLQLGDLGVTLVGCGERPQRTLVVRLDDLALRQERIEDLVHLRLVTLDHRSDDLCWEGRCQIAEDCGLHDYCEANGEVDIAGPIDVIVAPSLQFFLSSAPAPPILG